MSIESVPRATLLRIGPGERWCRSCGNDVPAGRGALDPDRVDNARCPYCGSRDLMPVDVVLQPGEFYFSS